MEAAGSGPVQGSGEAGPFPFDSLRSLRVRDDNNGALRDDNNEAGWADFWMMTARRLGMGWTSGSARAAADLTRRNWV